MHIGRGIVLHKAQKARLWVDALCLNEMAWQKIGDSEGTKATIPQAYGTLCGSANGPSTRLLIA